MLVTRAGRRCPMVSASRRACCCRWTASTPRAWCSREAWSSTPTRVRLDGNPTGADLGEIRDRAGNEFPQAGWSIRTRLNAAPALSANIERFSQFLTLVGLTALVVGGVGVANAVRAYLDGKRGVIATFKSLGASGGFVFVVYLIQILHDRGHRHRRSGWCSGR